MTSPISSLVEYLGYPSDARLLIINGDDLGMCAAVNAATFDGYEQGLLTSMTLMAPCPWARDAMRYLTAHPEIPFGVHLTTTAEWDTYRWGPVLDSARVPSLVDAEKRFYRSLPEFFKHARAPDVDAEFRAQVDLVTTAGLTPTHIDSHMGNYHLKDEFFALAKTLALEKHLLMRIGFPQRAKDLQAAGVPVPDYLVFDTYRVPRGRKRAFYYETVRTLKPGVTELVVHVAHDTPELRAISDNWWTRVEDFEFIMDPDTRSFLDDEGIIRIGYDTLAAAWRGAAA